MRKILSLALASMLILSLAGCSSDTSTDGEESTNEAAVGLEDGTSSMLAITSLSPGETVSSPFTVSGTTTVTEETTIHLESYGVDGVLNSGPNKWHTTTEGTFDFGSTYYFIAGGGAGQVEVFLLDDDGNELDRAVISVIFE
jgi:hypothetical protein